MAVGMVSKAYGIKGFLPSSMLDWEGYLVSTIFMGGCNLRCPFCHNSSLVLEAKSLPEVSIAEIERAIAEKEGWLDGICITGGEPTINKQLPDLLRLIKNLGLKIKLDTNGTRPDILKNLINEDLLDAVAMDIKTGFSKYPLATAAGDLSDKVKESISILLDAEGRGEIGVEFRTTVVPTYVGREDVLGIARYLGESGAQRYFLQQFNPKEVMDPGAGKIKPFNPEFIAKLAKEASQFLPTKVR